MNSLEARQLRYFVAVAEELHFGRAAERLSMAQPPLSRAIRELEGRLGVALFERTTRRVALTAAGEVFLQDAHSALDAIDLAERRARHAGRTAPSLRLVLKADLDAGLLAGILAAYREEPEALPVELVLVGFDEQAQALRDGRADVGLLLAPYDDRALEAEPLLTEPMLVALAAADPLAARPSLCLADLADRTVPGATRADEHGSSLRRNGREGPTRRQVPGAAHAPSNLTEIFRLVELGSIVCFLPRSVTLRYPRPEVAYRPVHDLPPAVFSIAWPHQARSRAVAAFVRAAERAAASCVSAV